MKIIPSDKDFTAWNKVVPKRGDLLFARSEKESWLRAISLPTFTSDQVKAQNLDLWTLNHRSWYGYALNAAKICVWIPAGQLEEIDGSIAKEIARSQIKLNVPTLIPAKQLAVKTTLQVGAYKWITAKTLANTSETQRLKLMRAWYKQNEIFTYSSIAKSELPDLAIATLKRLGLNAKINSFAASSGANCFALTAAAVASNSELANLWLHWKPLENLLKINSYRVKRRASPEAGEILVFQKNGSPVHAAIFIGDGLYLEKPGQDFYEPYRIAKLKDWRSEWQGCQLQVWGKI